MKYFCQQNGYQNLMSVMGVGPRVRSENRINNYRLTTRGVNTWPVKICEALAHFENFTATFRNIREAIKQLYKSDAPEGTYNSAKAVLREAKFVSYNNSTKLWTLTDFGKAWLLWVNGAEVGPVLEWLGQEGEPCDYKAFRKALLHIYDSEIRKDESHYQKPTTTYAFSLTKNYTIGEFLNFIGGLLTHNDYVIATTHAFIRIKNDSGEAIRIGSIEIPSKCTAKIRTAANDRWTLLNPEDMLSPELKMALEAYKRLSLGDREKFLEMSQNIPCEG